MRGAIPRLEKRIAELQAFDPQTVNDRSDARIGALEQAIDETLVAIFGADTVDYNPYRGAKRLDRAVLRVCYQPPIHEIRAGLQRGKEQADSILEGIIARFKEELELTPPQRQIDRQPAVEHAASRRALSCTATTRTRAKPSLGSSSVSG